MNYPPQSEQTKAHIAEQKQKLIDISEEFARQNCRSLANKTLIEGFLSAQEKKRYTAAGLPVIRASLKHISRQFVAPGNTAGKQSDRVVVCEMSVLFIGDSLCRILQSIPADNLVRVEGFLTRNAYKDELSWVILEATDIVQL